MMRKHVISLYDYTGVAVTPWAKAGYDCVCFDIQHDAAPRVVTFDSGGAITYIRADLHQQSTLDAIAVKYGDSAVFGMAFPVCTDLAVSGAAWFAAKAKINPLFQDRAAGYAVSCAKLFDAIGVPYFIENPVSVLATKWRKPDHSFHPYEYGGYIPESQAEHPTWPEYIAPRDAYPKKTCLWTGCGFAMPAKRPVDCPTGYSAQHKKLGGKSAKTKNIRSATPRGFASAVFEANHAKGGTQ